MRLRPARAIITIIGIVASTCAVIWVVSGYDALVSQFEENTAKYLGRYDALILPVAPPGAPAAVDPHVLTALTEDPGLVEVNPVHQSRVSVTKASATRETEAESPLGMLVGSRPPVYGAPPIDPILVATPALQAPYELLAGTWLDSDPAAAVLSVGAARQVGVTTGDEILVTSLANQVRLRVVGLVEQPPESPALGGAGGGPRGGGQRPANRQRAAGSTERSAARRGAPASADDEIHASSMSKRDDERPSASHVGIPSPYVHGVAVNAVYVRPRVAERINGFAFSPSVVQLALSEGVSVSEIRDRWKSLFDGGQPPLRIVGYDEVLGGMQDNASVASQRSQAWAATGMACLAAVFIIFSTLSMGVTEKVREFAMLRAVALTRWQLAKMIVLESTALAVLGWLGGLFAGWVLLRAVSRVASDLLATDAVLGWSCVLLSAAAVLGGALAAAVVPAVRAMRIAPIEGMANRARVPRAGWSMPLAMLGLGLAASAPLSVFVVPMSDSWRTWIYATVTWPALLVGMMLLTPAAVLLCEHLFGPLVTRLLGLDHRLTANQMSSNMWRTIGASLALSLGLALYCSTQTWGYSMLQPFLPGDWLPDVLVAFHPLGVDEDAARSIEEIEGVKAGEVLPLYIEQARFDWRGHDVPARLRQDNAVLFGLDPWRAFGTENPFLDDLQFVRGNPQTAAQALAAGRACIISQDFQMMTGLGIGDEVRFVPPHAPDNVVAYRVAGVVALPGWPWFTKFSGVRRHFVRTSTMIFAGGDDVRRDFGLPHTEFFWLNLEEGASLAAVEKKLQAIAESQAGASFHAEGYGEVKAYRPFARVTATQTVRKAISMRADDMIRGMSRLPLITLAIMSLAVVNAMIASVRARTWELGILRSIGLTRSQVVRLIVAEALLIGLVACGLSLAFGVIAGWCGVGMALYGGWFAGPSTFLIPWTQLAAGFLLTLALCLVAAAYPAFRAGRAEPLVLLQAGRGAM